MTTNNGWTKVLIPKKYGWTKLGGEDYRGWRLDSRVSVNLHNAPRTFLILGCIRYKTISIRSLRVLDWMLVYIFILYYSWIFRITHQYYIQTWQKKQNCNIWWVCFFNLNIFSIFFGENQDSKYGDPLYSQSSKIWIIFWTFGSLLFPHFQPLLVNQVIGNRQQEIQSTWGANRNGGAGVQHETKV